MNLVCPDISPLGLYVIWPVIDLFHAPLVIIRVARTEPYLLSTIIWPVIDWLHVSSGIIPVARNGISMYYYNMVARDGPHVKIVAHDWSYFCLTFVIVYQGTN